MMDSYLLAKNGIVPVIHADNAILVFPSKTEKQCETKFRNSHTELSKNPPNSEYMFKLESHVTTRSVSSGMDRTTHFHIPFQRGFRFRQAQHYVLMKRREMGAINM
mmetsp:Transcript_17852/g.27586  ORF Transcript_17852/g.27586 Transcript_17852/m.27586 type:complete len:106 (+) Transcript_17852:617-934(+)